MPWKAEYFFKQTDSWAGGLKRKGRSNRNSRIIRIFVVLWKKTRRLGSRPSIMLARSRRNYHYLLWMPARCCWLQLPSYLLISHVGWGWWHLEYINTWSAPLWLILIYCSERSSMYTPSRTECSLLRYQLIQDRTKCWFPALSISLCAQCLPDHKQHLFLCCFWTSEVYPRTPVMPQSSLKSALF